MNETSVILVPFVGIGDQPGGHAVDLVGDVLVRVGGSQGVPEIHVRFQTGKEGMTFQQTGEVATEEVCKYFFIFIFFTFSFLFL